MNYPIQIPLSKKKLLLLTIAGIAFIVCCISLLFYPEKFINPVFGRTTIIVVGFIGFAVFSFFTIQNFKKILDKKMGLTITKEGIIDNSSAISIGLINWKDINKIVRTKMISNNLFIVDTNEHKKYFAKARNIWVKKSMKTNYKWLGSPLIITPTSLSIPIGELEKLLQTAFEENKR